MARGTPCAEHHVTSFWDEHSNGPSRSQESGLVSSIDAAVVQLCVDGSRFAVWTIPSEAIHLLLQTHCIACHDAGNKTNGLDLSTLRWDDPSQLPKLVRIYDRVLEGEMPPRQSQPSLTTRKRLFSIKAHASFISSISTGSNAMVER